MYKHLIVFPPTPINLSTCTNSFIASFLDASHPGDVIYLKDCFPTHIYSYIYCNNVANEIF